MENQHEPTCDRSITVATRATILFSRLLEIQDNEDCSPEVHDGSLLKSQTNSSGTAQLTGSSLSGGGCKLLGIVAQLAGEPGGEGSEDHSHCGSLM